MTIVRLWSLFCLLILASCGGKQSALDYKVALDPAWYSVELPGKESALTAFSTELITAIGEKENIKIEVFQNSWNNLMFGLQKNDYQAISSPMQPYLFYEKLYLFSDIYLETGPVIVVQESSSIKNLSELGGLEVGIVRGSSNALILEKYPTILQRSYDSVPAAFNDLSNNNIQAVIVDVLTADAFTRDLYHGQLKIASQPLVEQGIRLVGLQQNSEKLIQKFNRGLARLKKDGTYSKIAKKWGLGE